VGGTNVNQGKLLVSGSIPGPVKVASAGTMGGTGSTGAITAASLGNGGHISPGNSPGILTAPSVEGGTGLAFDFEFTQIGSPTYASATASGNDVLHLTSTTPFTFGNLNSGNVVNVYLATA